MNNELEVKKNIYKDLCNIETELFNTCIMINNRNEKHDCDLFKILMEDCNKFKNIKQRNLELKLRKIEK